MRTSLLDLKPVPARWAIHMDKKTTMQNGLSPRILIGRRYSQPSGTSSALDRNQQQYHISDNRPNSN